jgi:hypothetical protein
MPDLGELLQESARTPVRPVDAPAVVQQAGVRLRRRRAVAAVAGITIVVAGSALTVDRLRPPSQVTFAPASEPATEGVSHVPDDLRFVLATEAQVHDGTFGDGGLTVEETLAAFQDQYTKPIETIFDHEPTVYAATITRASSPIIENRSVRIVYIPHVDPHFSIPAPPPGQPRPTEGPKDAHFFAFFDAKSGKSLMNAYIGSDATP